MQCCMTRSIPASFSHIGLVLMLHYLQDRMEKEVNAVFVAASTGASLLATTAVLAIDSAAAADAQSALNAADSYVRVIADENPLQTSNATFANLILLANLAHDGSLIQYYQNLTAGM